MPITVPRLSKKAIVDAAERFAEQYGRSNGRYFLIDDVVELELGIDIVPMAGLRKDSGVDAFMSGDFTQIVFDDELLSRYAGRYRFTIAHEVGHWQLHKEIFKGASFSSAVEWREFYSSISNADYNVMERQCNIFASQLLMPHKDFRELLFELSTTIESDVAQLCGLGLSAANVKASVTKRVAVKVSEVFGVSVPAATVRLDTDPGLMQIVQGVMEVV